MSSVEPSRACRGIDKNGVSSIAKGLCTSVTINAFTHFTIRGNCGSLINQNFFSIPINYWAQQQTIRNRIRQRKA
jgi:hypothetical protein